MVEPLAGVDGVEVMKNAMMNSVETAAMFQEHGGKLWP